MPTAWRSPPRRRPPGNRPGTGPRRRTTTYLVDLVEQVFERFGRERIRSFWLVGHSQGGMTANRLLGTDYFADRVDGWLSLSGGRIGPAERAPNFGPPRSEADRAAMERFLADRRRLEPPTPPTADLSFIYTTGEHEIASLPETSPWAERYGAGPRAQLPDVVDDQPGRIHDSRWDANPTLSWGRQAGARDGEDLRVPECQRRPGDRRRGPARQRPHRGARAPNHRGVDQADGLGAGRQGENPVTGFESVLHRMYHRDGVDTLPAHLEKTYGIHGGEGVPARRRGVPCGSDGERVASGGPPVFRGPVPRRGPGRPRGAANISQRSASRPNGPSGRGHSPATRARPCWSRSSSRRWPKPSVPLIRS